MDEQPQLLTVKQAAHELGLAPTTIYTMMDREKIKFVIVRKTQRGLNRRIPRSEIERLKPLYEIPVQQSHGTDQSEITREIEERPD